MFETLSGVPLSPNRDVWNPILVGSMIKRASRGFKGKEGGPRVKLKRAVSFLYALPLSPGIYLRTLGGTPNRDPCSLWGLIWGLPRDIGVT